MSRITFASPSGRAELRGSERAHMGLLAADLTCGVFRPGGLLRDEPLFRVTHFRRETYNRPGGALEFERDFRSFLGVNADRPFLLGDRRPSAFAVCLNTLLALGNDALCLLARLHGQCEIHAWVDGPHRAWLAGIIDRGRASGLFRADQGWEAVAAFLRSDTTQPVVTSYSVTDGFPNARAAGITEETAREAWYEQPPAAQWAQAMTGLRAADGLEMRPDRWAFPDYHFGDGDTAFSVLEAAYAMTPAAAPA